MQFARELGLGIDEGSILQMKVQAQHTTARPATAVSSHQSGVMERGADRIPDGKAVDARLTITGGPDAGRSIQLDETTVIIGTGPGATIRLIDAEVFPEHLRLSRRPDGVHIEDLGSPAGSRIGKIQIRDVVVADSTSIAIGRTTLTLSIEGPSKPLAEPHRFGDAIGESAEMRSLFALLERASAVDVGVLVEGESGVGKDVLARSIHARSARSAGPFVTLDCGAISPNLVESELFGHARGAFTGAEQQRDGVFVQADGGTLFLDEIGELPADIQPKLLRVLETLYVQPVGGGPGRRVDVRIVAATNRKLADVGESVFRRDLFYRIAVLRVEVPPLRKRTADILPLARSFLQRIPGHETDEISPALEDMLLAHRWPGNVRELKNMILRYAALGVGPHLFQEPSVPGPASADGDLSHLGYDEARAIALARFERSYFSVVLAKADNHVTRAAAHAGVRRGSFYRMLRRIRSADTTP